MKMTPDFGNLQLHRCPDVGVTNCITSNSCADGKLDMADVESTTVEQKPLIVLKRRKRLRKTP